MKENFRASFFFKFIIQRCYLKWFIIFKIGFIDFNFIFFSFLLYDYDHLECLERFFVIQSFSFRYEQSSSFLNFGFLKLKKTGAYLYYKKVVFLRTNYFN